MSGDFGSEDGGSVKGNKRGRGIYGVRRWCGRMVRRVRGVCRKVGLDGFTCSKMVEGVVDT